MGCNCLCLPDIPASDTKVLMYHRTDDMWLCVEWNGDKLLLTDFGRVKHICISHLTNSGSDNGLSPGRRQAIIWTNAGILLIGPLDTNFSDILITIHTFSFKKMHLKRLSAKWQPFYLSVNVVTAPGSLWKITYIALTLEGQSISWDLICHVE